MKTPDGQNSDSSSCFIWSAQSNEEYGNIGAGSFGQSKLDNSARRSSNHESSYKLSSSNKLSKSGGSSSAKGSDHQNNVSFIASSQDSSFFKQSMSSQRNRSNSVSFRSSIKGSYGSPHSSGSVR